MFKDSIEEIALDWEKPRRLRRRLLKKQKLGFLPRSKRSKIPMRLRLLLMKRLKQAKNPRLLIPMSRMMLMMKVRSLQQLRTTRKSLI